MKPNEHQPAASVEVRVDLQIDLPEGPEANRIIVDGGLVRLVQTFSNLLINAAKFTQDYGNITVSISRLGNTVTARTPGPGAGTADAWPPR